MVEHIVLFKWQETATPQAIEEIMAELRKLKTEIPNILDLTCGETFTNRAQGYTHGLVVRFSDRAALEVYGPHLAHQKIVQQLINPVRADSLVLDYEF